MNKRHNAFKRPWLVGAVAAVMVSVTPMAQAEEQSWRYTYYADGLMETADGPRTDVSDITTYTYDTQGNVATVTNAAGHVTTYNTYDAAGRVLSVTDANGITTEFQYHPRGWLTQVSVLDPAGGPDYTTTYTYYADGELETLTQPNGSVLTFEYNGANHLTAIHNDLGERIDYVLDAAGNRTRQTVLSADGTIVYVLQTAYDELSRVMDVIGNNGQQDSIEYDANDNPLLAADARGAQTEQQYDALNRVHTLIDAEQGQTQFTYDGQDRIKTVTDARGNTTTYDYDGLGNLKSLDSPDTGLTTYQYDSAGNRIQSTDARGVVTLYDYDALNRLISVQYPADASLDLTYVYDSTPYGQGRIARVDDHSGSTQYSYDFLGRVTQKISRVGALNLTVVYAYSGNQLTSITYPSGRSVHYQYDLLGRISEVSTQAEAGAAMQSLAVDMDYLSFGPPRKWQYGNGLQQIRQYDLDYRLQHIQLSGGQTLYHTLYDYDLANNISAIADAVVAAKSQDFDYDLLNRLTQAQGLYGEIRYSYDAVGNRLTKSTGQGGQSLLETYSYDDISNRLLGLVTQENGTPIAARDFFYDGAGNVIQQIQDGDFKDYQYSAANRMASVSDNGSPAGDFTYNAFGQRVRADYGDHSEVFVYGEGGELLAIVDQAGQTLREYLYVGSEKVGLVVHEHNTGSGLDLSNTLAYGGQDSAGTLSLAANGTSLTLQGNRWRATAQTFEVTADTVLEFDFESDGRGEIQGIGFEEDDTASSNRLFRLVGSQVWAVDDFTYTGGKQHFVIPVGQYYVGSAMRLVFANDHDGSPQDAYSVFSNIQICTGPCSASAPIELSATESFGGQDSGDGTVTTTADGLELILFGNRWQRTLDTYVVTANTVLEFEFESDARGEVHAIGLDEDNGASSGRAFQLAGSQAWGRGGYGYTGGRQQYAIPVGQFFTGSAMHLVFVNDHDSAPKDSFSIFRNVRLCEGPCPSSSGSAGGTLDPQLYYVHNDHLGTPKLLTDAEQSVAWSADYTPFGVMVSGDGDAEASRFPGQYFDVATGVSYNYFRDYDPSLGRYIQSDPIGLQGGINTYAYVGGNPLRFIDPFGLKPVYDKDGNILYDTCFFANSPLKFLCDLGTPDIPLPDDLPVPPLPDDLPSNPLACTNLPTFYQCMTCCTKPSHVPSVCKLKCMAKFPEDPANPMCFSP